MSYTIEYARQFIKSESGYTPVWLAGSNNVTETRNGKERRVREWGVWCKQLGVSEQELLITANKMTGGYGEHWKRGGKYLDDDALIKWVITGVNSAMTIEDILAANPEIRCIICRLVSDSLSVMYQTAVSTTYALDEWIEQVKNAPEYGKSFPVIDFGSSVESIRSKPKEKDDEVGYCVKRGRDYFLVEYDTSHCAFSRNREAALIFPYEEAVEAMRRTGGTRVVSAATKVPGQQAIIRLTAKADGSVRYVSKNTSKSVFTIESAEFARRYSSVSSARSALKSPGFINLLKARGWEPEVVPVEN